MMMLRNAAIRATTLPSSRISLMSSTRISTQVRQYSATPSKKESNSGLYLALGGLAGIGAWYAMGGFNGDIKQKISQISADNGEPALSNSEFRPFVLKDIKKYNHDSAFYIFELPDNKKSGMFVASALVVRGEGDQPSKDGKPVVRPYTPVNPPDEKGRLELLIKHYPNGAMTSYIGDLKPGDKLMFKGPIPKFPYKSNQFEEIGMVAGGTGITPMWQLIDHIASDKNDKTKVTLLYSNKTEEDILLREKFDELKKDPRFNIVYFLDKAPKNWQGETGFISKEAVDKYLPKAEAGEKAHIFVCGPPPQVKSIAGPKVAGQQGEIGGVLKELGFKSEQVFKF